MKLCVLWFLSLHLLRVLIGLTINCKNPIFFSSYVHDSLNIKTFDIPTLCIPDKSAWKWFWSVTICCWYCHSQMLQYGDTEMLRMFCQYRSSARRWNLLPQVGATNIVNPFNDNISNVLDLWDLRFKNFCFVFIFSNNCHISWVLLAKIFIS